MSVQRYQDLNVWKEAIELAIETYDASDEIPSYERFGLTPQLRRAAVSIPSNIAEGQGRSRAEFRHFLMIARGSLQELETLLLIGARRGHMSAQSLSKLHQRASTVGRLLNGLRRSLAN